MASPDQSPLSLNYFLVLFLLLYSHTNFAEAQNDPSAGYHTEERNALLALRSVFNNPFINSNWTHLQCYLNNTPMWYGIQCSNGRVTGIVLEDLELTGRVNIDALYNLTQLSVLSFRNNSVAGNVMDFSRNPEMTDIDLSSNVFFGHIDRSLLDLKSLRSLYLQDNLLTGPLPAFDQESLKELNVSHNYLNGSIPKTHTLQSLGADSYSNNMGLCGSPSAPCSSSTDESSSDPKKGDSAWNSFAKLFVIVDVVGFVIVITLFIAYYMKVRKLKQLQLPEKDDGDIEAKDANEETGEMSRMIEGGEANSKGKLVLVGEEGGFELSDLLKASAEGLGKGNFGNCYKAKLENRSPVVVKRLRDLKPLSGEEFMKQVQVIASHKHPNLLPLLAYYYSKEEKLLVHKFAEKGSLFNLIHGNRGTIDRIPFRWSSRLMVARGVARALEYLHIHTKSSSANDNTAPHGNLKSSNVFLDDNDTAVVSDYGLSSLISVPIAAQRMVSYKSPEYQNGKKLSEKSDTWSYGCLLLELLTGRVSAHSAPPGVAGAELCSWVHRAVREEWTAEIFDFELSSPRKACKSMLALLQVAIRCCDKYPEKRPEMTEVVREVENIKSDESEDEDDLSNDRSLTDDSASTTASGISAEQKRIV